jgi:hypothetical protein
MAVAFMLRKVPLAPVRSLWTSGPVQEHQLAPDGSPLTSHKVFGCDLAPDGQTYLRSFRRGAWENQFLRHVESVVTEAGVQVDHEVLSIPTGGGKARVMRSLVMTPQSATG